MKKTILLAPIMVAFLFTACNNASNNQEASDNESETEELMEDTESMDEPEDEEIADMHNSENSLDWAGTYEGTLPCADCPGIKMELKINSDETYSLYQEYLERDMKGTETGTFSWDEDGNIVTLTNEDGREDLYQVGENQLFRLDPEGNRVQGELADQYILKKVEDE
ncbi:MAG TPA: copper resistance protein NlpE [Sphingobacterium sp.]|nr:copper resistance protein NlpE [Sphingobacterium sp.]